LRPRPLASLLLLAAAGVGCADPPPPVVDLEALAERIRPAAGEEAVLVNFWATWCVPCVAELPLVEALHRSLAEREDLQVITVSIDQNPGLVQPFVTKHELSMPVLFGAELVQEWWSGAISIPRTWLVDREGAVRYRQMGFSAAGKDTWVAEARERMESAAGPDPASR